MISVFILNTNTYAICNSKNNSVWLFPHYFDCCYFYRHAHKYSTSQIATGHAFGFHLGFRIFFFVRLFILWHLPYHLPCQLFCLTSVSTQSPAMLTRHIFQAQKTVSGQPYTSVVPHIIPPRFKSSLVTSLTPNPDSKQSKQVLFYYSWKF